MLCLSMSMSVCRLAINFSDRYPLDPPEVSSPKYCRL